MNPLNSTTKFVNLTPHKITVVNEAGETVLEVAPSGQVARVAISKVISKVEVGKIGVIPIYNIVKGDVVGMPEEVEGEIYIVSGMVREAIYGKPYVVSPGELVRNKEGQPIGCLGFFQ